MNRDIVRVFGAGFVIAFGGVLSGGEPLVVIVCLICWCVGRLTEVVALGIEDGDKSFGQQICEWWVR